MPGNISLHLGISHSALSCLEYMLCSPRFKSIDTLDRKGRSMPTPPVPEGRRNKRLPLKKRASLIFNHHGSQTRMPCLVLDATEVGFRLRVNCQLRPGQALELVLDEDPLSAMRCKVVWSGKIGSKQAGEIGVERV